METLGTYPKWKMGASLYKDGADAGTGRDSCSRGPEIRSLPLSTGHGDTGNERGKDLISMRPTPGGQWLSQL